jgi:hypothetical protein
MKISRWVASLKHWNGKVPTVTPRPRLWSTLGTIGAPLLLATTEASGTETLAADAVAGNLAVQGSATHRAEILRAELCDHTGCKRNNYNYNYNILSVKIKQSQRRILIFASAEWQGLRSSSRTWRARGHCCWPHVLWLQRLPTPCALGISMPFHPALPT